MKKLSVLVGAEIGVEMGGDKAPCLTTEYAHRWNSYGLQHVIVVEDESKNNTNRDAKQK